MKTITLIFLLLQVFTGFNINAQKNDESCEKIIIDADRFSSIQADPFDFGLSQSGILKNIRDVNSYPEIDDIIKVEDNCLKFTILYGCGCGEVNYDLISDGEIDLDEYGFNFIKVKFEFEDDDMCSKRCHKRLSFDLKKLITLQEGVSYIKFDKVDKPIEIK